MNSARRPLFSGEAARDPFLAGVELRHPVLAVERRVGAPANRQVGGREGQVVSLVAIGKAQKEIAQELGINPRTVGTYLSRAALKLGLEHNLEVFLRAAKSSRLLSSFGWEGESG